MTALFCRISGSCAPFCICSTSPSASACVPPSRVCPVGSSEGGRRVSQPLWLSAAVTELQEGQLGVVSAELSMAAADG